MSFNIFLFFYYLFSINPWKILVPKNPVSFYEICGNNRDCSMDRKTNDPTDFETDWLMNYKLYKKLNHVKFL